MTDVILAVLADPFPIQTVCFYAGPINAAATRCQAVPYIDALHLCRRLDNSVGPARWSEQYQTLSDGTYRCGIALRMGNRWLARWSRPHPDLLDTLPDTHPFDAFTEAGLKWGMGRYLTMIPPIWVDAQIAPNEQGLPQVIRIDQFSARAQLARILAETRQLADSASGQPCCPTCEKRQQLLFDIQETQITLNHNGDCLTLDWPAIRTFSVEKLVLFHAGLKARLEMLFEDAPPPHLSTQKTKAHAILTV
jgi:hypothetical protein